ncbi:MAG: polyprenyl synthetase family protein [Elusimicrobia bacterium]|nr:polyprenyl synthetase family protein [Elusimicrobiota bacterium]
MTTPRMPPRLERSLSTAGRLVEARLRAIILRGGRAAIPFLAPAPETLRKSMLYSLMAGGKRLRPALVIEAAACCGLPARKVLDAACAMEMIHTYSLIHDDLPSMDDDDLRRGKPTNHKVFGEAAAILAGDALLTLAFEAAAGNAAALRLPGDAAAELVRVIAAGSGWRGMVGGQMADLEAEGPALRRLANGGRTLARRRLDYVHIHKTAALITASLEAGAVLGRAGASRRAALREYGRCVGLAFQIADDVLDRVGDKAKLGKSGSDLANDKLTYPRLYGVAASRDKALSLVRDAHQALRPFGARAAVLHDLADDVVSRDR